MKNLSEYRTAAREALRGNWCTSALYFFVGSMILMGISYLSGNGFEDSIFNPWHWGLNFVSILLASPLIYGMFVGFLLLLRGKEMQIEMLFGGFVFRIWKTEILKNMYIALWSLLLLVPGIVKNYSYSMTDYILLDNPDISGNEAIERSMEMMSGNKMRLFLLDLSFIGWGILCIFTFGIGFYWLAPYVLTSHADFYEDLKLERTGGRW